MGGRASRRNSQESGSTSCVFVFNDDKSTSNNSICPRMFDLFIVFRQSIQNIN